MTEAFLEAAWVMLLCGKHLSTPTFSSVLFLKKFISPPNTLTEVMVLIPLGLYRHCFRGQKVLVNGLHVLASRQGSGLSRMLSEATDGRGLVQAPEGNERLQPQLGHEKANSPLPSTHITLLTPNVRLAPHTAILHISRDTDWGYRKFVQFCLCTTCPESHRPHRLRPPATRMLPTPKATCKPQSQPVTPTHQLHGNQGFPQLLCRFINLLEQLADLRKTVYLPDYLFFMKTTIQGRADGVDAWGKAQEADAGLLACSAPRTCPTSTQQLSKPLLLG